MSTHQEWTEIDISFSLSHERLHDKINIFDNVPTNFTTNMRNFWKDSQNKNVSKEQVVYNLRVANQ